MAPVRFAQALFLLATTVFAACFPGATKAQLSDAGVKAKILWELKADGIDMAHLTVEVHAGTASVSGLVPSSAQRRRIHDLLLRTPGVDDTIENVAVETPP